MPHTAILYIAERCNQKCVFCLEENGDWAEFIDPSTSEVFDVLDRLHATGARHITFMGGETFFRKDLDRIVARAKETGYTRIGVTTNGTVLSKAGFIRRLVDAGLDFIEFSVHGHTKELANAISRSNITFDRQAQALREIADIGDFFTIVNVVICHENHRQLRDIARHVCETYPSIPVRFKFKFVSLQGWAEDRADAATPLRYSDVDFVEVGDYLAQKDADFWFYNVPLCHLGPHAKRSHEAATLVADERYFDFDHRQDADYYDSGHQLEGRVWPGASCRPCAFRPICPGLEESYRRAHGNGELTTRPGDPRDAEDVVAFALADRGLDPTLAAERLASLSLEARPEKFVRNRPDGALRFLMDGRGPLDVTVEPASEGKRSFAATERFALSYRVDDEADANPDSRVMALLERCVSALREGEATSASLHDVRRAVARAGAGHDGWRIDGATEEARAERKPKRLVVLPDLSAAR
jgi:organic radical activating enzyme